MRAAASHPHGARRQDGSRRRGLGLLFLTLLLLAAAAAQAQPPQRTPAFRTPYLDRSGVVRWKDNGKEIVLFGANYVLPSASDYRAAGYLGLDRKRMIDDDMAHFARMGWDGLRLTFWGDWESSDREGNLIANDHLDLLDYLIAKARERGIYLLFSPIQTYNAGWPDALVDSAFPASPDTTHATSSARAPKRLPHRPTTCGRCSST